MQLIGRTKEVALLQTYVDSQQAEFIAMYGRRRVGKTFLISNMFADRIIFKGGSSLSKTWDLIGRMSEDVDLAYDSNFGIFEGDEPSVKQIKKLRKQSSLFVQNEFCEALKSAITKAGLDDWCSVEAQPNGTGNDTYPEPRQLYISYKSLFEDKLADTSSAYVKPIVMLEVSSRSLIEPTGKAKVKSMIAREFANIDTDVADKAEFAAFAKNSVNSAEDLFSSKVKRYRARQKSRNSSKTK